MQTQFIEILTLLNKIYFIQLTIDCIHVRVYLNVCVGGREGGKGVCMRVWLSMCVCMCVLLV